MTEQDDQNGINIQKMLEFYLGARDSKSPPKAQVDEASLQQAMDRNKESLKVKLMMRRPINQLVDQGIIPSPKKPLAYLEQCQKLERAKTENILKNLMKTRPDRQALIDHHILEDTTIDPSLQDKQRQLKKARLADDLNDRLSHRPGPLELVKGNILQIDESFAQAVKEGQIPFKRTCEGQALRHPAPSFIFEDDSGSDVALSPPQDLLDQSLSSMPSVESMVLSPYPNHDSPSNSMGELRITSATPPSSLPSPVSNHSMLSSVSSPSEHQPQKEVVSTTRRKKSKPKAQPKARTIKFHEYKGPPSAQKNQASPSKDETSYELLLQQQTLFLQWQLKMQQKFSKVMLPAPQPTGDQLKNANSVQGSSVELPQNNSPPPSKHFEDMKVNALKAELKKRNLPVSGSKTQLLERLRNHLESSSNQIIKQQPTMDSAATSAGIPLNGHIIIDTRPQLVDQSAVTSSHHQPVMEAPAALMVYNTVPMQVQSRPGSAAPMDVESAEAMDCSTDNEEIVKRQHQKILQLERELKRSQQQLQQHQWLQQQAHQHAQQQVLLASHPVPIAPAPPQITQAVVQLKPTQQLLQQASKLPAGSSEQQSAFVKANLAAFIHSQQLNNVRLKNGVAALNQQNVPQYANVKPIVLCSAQTVPAVIEKPRANSLPNGVAQQKRIWPSSVPNLILPKLTVGADAKLFLQKAPPDYMDAVKPQGKAKEKSKKSGRKSVKSQEVDDVLDVLISHGELPPSAAQDPVTPSTPESAKVGLAPTFPNVSEIQPTLSAPAPPCVPAPEQQQPPPAPLSLSSNQDPPPQDPASDQGLMFDLQLEFQDLESMDLGMLDHSEAPPSRTNADAPSQNNPAPSYGELDMDMDITEWLDILTNNTSGVSNANNTTITTAPHYSSYNGGDPLLPMMENNQETLDMFGMDNLEFKMPADSNLLNWDKVDYAT